ncbi:MAG: lantibiotic dehydratase, partial [Chloroflexota bacterium]
SGVVASAFQPAAPTEHHPRITIDRLVLSREQWTIEVAESEWAFVKDEASRIYQARRWREEYGLPERVFFRVPIEEKPMAADFSSIVLMNLFAKLVRQTKEAGFATYSVSEMLPDMEQLWLPDSAGRRYSSEFRFVAVDGAYDAGVV